MPGGSKELIDAEKVYNDVMEIVKGAFGGWGSIAVSITATAAAVPVVAITRRSAAWSALVLGLRSRFYRRAPTHSVRADVVDEIREQLRLRELDGLLVVIGDKGVGKTTAIKTATEK